MATTPSKRAPGVSSVVKLGICRPKRMQRNLLWRERRGSPAREPPEPGQRHRALGGLERAQRREPRRGRPQRVAHQEAAEGGDQRGQGVTVDTDEPETDRARSSSGVGPAFQQRPTAPRPPGRRPAHPRTRAASRRTRRRCCVTSRLSERTSPCSSVEPATASGQPDSSSARRSRFRPLHSSRPSGAAGPWRPVRPSRRRGAATGRSPARRTRHGVGREGVVQGIEGAHRGPQLGARPTDAPAGARRTASKASATQSPSS